MEDPNLEVADLWKQFRDREIDNLPTQVKIFAIWLTLSNRYTYNLCVIGHRSGFIEGAGLAGIPVFYLNNERDDIPQIHEQTGGRPFRSKSKQDSRQRKHLPSDLLWRPVLPTAEGQPQKPPSRLRELADVMNTFIPVEVFEKRDKQAEHDQQLKLDDRYDHELMAALFMFMCCNVDINNTLPCKPRYIRKLPGWIVRVDMIHDECETVGHTPGPGKHHDPGHGETTLQLESRQERLQCGDVDTLEGAKVYVGRCIDENDPGKDPNYRLNTRLVEVARAQERRQELLQSYELIHEDKQQFLNLFWPYRDRWPQTGQEWLRRRYKFVMEEKCDPDVCLSGWFSLHEKVPALDNWYPGDFEVAYTLSDPKYIMQPALPISYLKRRAAQSGFVLPQDEDNVPHLDSPRRQDEL